MSNLTSHSIKIVLDDMPLDQMIKAGKYDRVSDHFFDERFLIRRGGEVRLYIVYFGHHMMTKIQVIRGFNKQGLRPAELPELLALGAAHPDLQRKFPLLALAREWCDLYGNVLVPFLGKDDHRRYLGCDRVGPEDRWDDHCRFVAVRK